MQLIKYILTGSLLLYQAFSLSAQEQDSPEALTYRMEAYGSAASGTYTPFWMVNNRYGIVPLESGNGYLRGSITNQQALGSGFSWGAALDVVAAAPRYRTVYIQQAYAELGYKSLLLSVGSRETYRSLWDRDLSSGDLMLSPNARPIPEIDLSMPAFTVVPGLKGWIQVKGDIAVGRSFDTDYLEDFIRIPQEYTQNSLWHHKSFFLRINDTRNGFPLTLALGLQHTAQWGGTSTNPKKGVQPHSLKDLVRVFFAQSGGNDATVSDQINVLGSHQISYDFQLGYTQKDWSLHAYYQHMSADKSGLLFYNGTDGLWGLQADFNSFPLIRKVVVEYMETRNQSGPFHFIAFDHDAHPGRGGGADDYYNNGEYTTGYSYFNRSIGSPLLPSPVYNTDRRLGFRSTRVSDWHLGMEGAFSPQLSYRMLFTVMNSWGRHYTPFLIKRTGSAFLAECHYTHPRLADWQFTGSVAGDTGNIVGDNGFGFSLKVSKRGILKKW